MKLVINRCYGGFSLSDKGVKYYASLKGIPLYPEPSKYGSVMPPTYWTVPPEKRTNIIDGDDWFKASLDERAASNKRHSEITLYCRDIPRDDEFLVKTVEALGSEANGMCADLEVIEIPDGVEWELDEYDGIETVHEKHRSWP